MGMKLQYLPFLLFGIIATPASAACAIPGEYELLAPIGPLSGCVDLAGYLKGILETTIGIAGILAVIMIVICGIQLMAAGSVSGKSAAKDCISNAIFGVLLAIGSWLLLNTINPLLLKNTLTLNNATTLSTPASVVTTEPNPTSGCVFKYKDVVTGNIKFGKADTCPSCENLRNNFQADPAHYLIQSACYQPTVTPVPPGSTAPPVTSAGSITCPQSGVNLCEPAYRQCSNPNCAQFAAMATANATGNATANLLKALIVQESSCIARPTDAIGFDGKSAGPIHLTPATANNFKGPCGVTENISLGWLAEKANWNKSICIAAQYINSMVGACGTNVRNLAAGYNAGPGRCADSASCSGDTSCDAGHPRVRQWECLYDDSAHKVCNGGLISTRKYADNVLYCTNNPGY
jgi:type IV secretory pathway VirB2 component (pilin)